MNYLVDTNIISELRKRHPDPMVYAWWETVTASEFFISALTIGEIRLGVERLRRKDPSQAERIQNWLAGLRETYFDHIVDIDARIAEEWARLNVPDPLPVIDGLLAATASVHGMTLVTRNVADLSGGKVRLLNPFTPSGDRP